MRAHLLGNAFKVLREDGGVGLGSGTAQAIPPTGGVTGAGPSSSSSSSEGNGAAGYRPTTVVVFSDGRSFLGNASFELAKLPADWVVHAIGVGRKIDVEALTAIARDNANNVHVAATFAELDSEDFIGAAVQSIVCGNANATYTTALPTTTAATTSSSSSASSSSLLDVAMTTLASPKSSATTSSTTSTAFDNNVTNGTIVPDVDLLGGEPDLQPKKSRNLLWLLLLLALLLLLGAGYAKRKQSRNGGAQFDPVELPIAAPPNAGDAVTHDASLFSTRTSTASLGQPPSSVATDVTLMQARPGPVFATRRMSVASLVSNKSWRETGEIHAPLTPITPAAAAASRSVQRHQATLLHGDIPESAALEMLRGKLLDRMDQHEVGNSMIAYR